MWNWIDALRALGYIAAFALAVFVSSKAVLTMIRMGRALEGIEKRFQNMWFTAEQVGSTRPPIITELIGYEGWDTTMVRGLIKSARERITILQTWFPEMEGDLDRWEFSNPENLKVEILMAHSDDPAILERVRFRRDFPHQVPDQELKSLVEKNVNACAIRLQRLLEETKKGNKNFSGTVSVYKQGMPFGPIYIIDGLALVGFYTPQVNCNAAPMLRLSANGKSGRLFEESIKTVKAASSTKVLFSTDTSGSL